MLWLWILLAVCLLIALLCWTKVGVWAAYDGQTLRLDARVGLLRLHILPPKAKKPQAEKPKKKKKPQKPKPEGAEEEPKRKLSFTLEDGKDALRTLLPPLKRALSRTWRGIQVKPLHVSLTLGGQEDPASSAELCGKLLAAVWGGMPVLERLLDIRDPQIHIGVDFGSPAPAVEGEAGVTLRIGTLLAVGFGAAVPGLRWFLRWRKRCKRAEQEKAEAPQESAA